jgi:hypothetical protein
VKLAGPGQRFVAPLVLGHRIYVPSCENSAGPGQLEAFEIVPLVP